MQSVIIYPLAGSIWGSPREYFGTPTLQLFTWMIYHLVLQSVKFYYSLTTPRFIILFVVLDIFHCFKMI